MGNAGVLTELQGPTVRVPASVPEVVRHWHPCRKAPKIENYSYFVLWIGPGFVCKWLSGTGWIKSQAGDVGVLHSLNKAFGWDLLRVFVTFQRASTGGTLYCNHTGATAVLQCYKNRNPKVATSRTSRMIIWPQAGRRACAAASQPSVADRLCRMSQHLGLQRS